MKHGLLIFISSNLMKRSEVDEKLTMYILAGARPTLGEGENCTRCTDNSLAQDDCG